MKVRGTSSEPKSREGRTSRQRHGDIIALCLFALLVTGAILEFTRERQAADTAQGRDPGVAVPLRPTQSLDLGESLANVVSDDASPTSGLWSIDPGPAATTVRALAPRAGPAVRLQTDGAPDAYDVARWRADAGVCAFLIRDGSQGRLTVDVRQLPSGGRIGLFQTPRVLRPPGSQRTLLMGQWSGSRADLFVLDRSRADDTMQVRVLSGESGFKSVVLAVVVPQPFDRKDWWVDLADVAGSGRSDIVMTTRFTNTTSRRVEVHALAAQANYSRYLLQVTTTAAATPVAGRRALVVLRRRQPSWLLFNVNTGRGASYPLAAGPPARTSTR